jgi:hypothetical protein
VSRAVRTATTPLESGWLEYREVTKLPRGDVPVVRAARHAFYSGAAHLFSVVEQSDYDEGLLDLLVAELDAYLADLEASVTP